MTTADMEARRLTASWLNILAASAVSVGGLSPVVTVILAPSHAGGEFSINRISAVAGVFLVLGISPPMIARSLVRHEPNRFVLPNTPHRVKRPSATDTAHHKPMRMWLK